MAKILDLRSLDKANQEREARIANNQKKLEEMATGEEHFDAAVAHKKSQSRLEANEMIMKVNPEVIDPSKTPYDQIVAIMRDNLQHITSVSESFKLSDPLATLIAHDRSRRVKAFDESIIPFENPVIRFTGEIATRYAGPIGIVARSDSPNDPEVCLYYRKQYLFSSLWDFALFMAGTPKYKHFYTLLLSLEDESARCSYINKVLTAIRRDEAFSITATPRQQFTEAVVNKSSKLEDYIAFSALCQYVTEKAINTKFVML